MSLWVKQGDTFEMKGRVVTVTPAAFECLPRVRDYLIEVAKVRETVTYGELRQELDLPYAPQGMGRFLDVLTQECRLRDEPSLAAIVVGAGTGEVGEDFEGDPVVERERVYAQSRWS